MRYLIIALLLTGCAHKPAPPITTTVTKVERIVVYPPAELLIIPPNDYPINVDKATQRDVSAWILKTEQRSRILETKLRELKRFFEDTK